MSSLPLFSIISVKSDAFCFKSSSSSSSSVSLFWTDAIGAHCCSSLFASFTSQLSSSNRHLGCSGLFALNHETTRLIANIQSEIKLQKAGSRSHFLSKFTRNPVTTFFESSLESLTGSSFPPQVTRATMRAPQLLEALTRKVESSLKKTLRTLSVCVGPSALVYLDRTGYRPFCVAPFGL